MDYTQEDLTKAGRKYDVVFDVVGKIPIKQGLGLLEPDGRYLVANPGLSHLFRGRWTSATTGKKVVMGYASSRLEDLLFLKELVEAGEVKPVIDRSYPLEQTAEAHRYVETGQKKGNVAITVAG
jgi:NADPH:quinone reductase-like Zn-dependent oxidoreductase